MGKGGGGTSLRRKSERGTQRPFLPLPQSQRAAEKGKEQPKKGKPFKLKNQGKKTEKSSMTEKEKKGLNVERKFWSKGKTLRKRKLLGPRV